MVEATSGPEPILCAPLLRGVDRRLLKVLRSLETADRDLHTTAGISLVRSVTVTSMMFMIPIPEIASAITETMIGTIVKMRLICLAAPRIPLEFSTEYFAPARCRLSSSNCTSRVSGATSSGLRA